MKKSFSPFFYVASMLGILMGFYTIERAIYFIWNHHGFAEATVGDIVSAFIHGLRFDIYALLFINIIPIILSFITFEKLQKKQIEVLKFLILIPNAFFIAINQIDVEFSNFAGRRMTLGNLEILLEAQGKISAFFITYGFLMATHILLMILFFYTTWRLANYFKNNPVHMKPAIYVCLIIFLVPFIVLGARGGLQRKPLSITHAIVFDGSYLNQMVLNSSFTMLRGKNSSQLKERKDFKDFAELKPYLNGFDSSPTNWKENFATEKTNVVLIIFESLSQDYMEFTPFLKELSEKGLIFTNNYANSRRSIEGISSILAGIPALMSDSYVTSPYFNNELRGLGTYFKNIGYQTSFFHGGLPGTMYFDQFTKKAGFDKYYSSADHPNPKDSDGFWGIYDEPFLQFALTEIDKMEKPFVSGIFTLTSHHPYKIPEEYKDLPKGKIPILQAIYYTDHSLRKFFESAQSKPWFKNTLFIITADHTSLPYTEEFDNSLGRFRIPMIFYHPSFTNWPKIPSYKLTQQVDIMPTLLDMFKIQDSNRSLFGKSIFNDKSSKVALLNDQTYYLVSDKYAVEMRPGHETLTFGIENNLKFKNSVENNLELEKNLKATIQYYNNGLLENSLYLK